MPDDKELQEPKEEDSYVWDNDSQLYIHHSSGFYHDPNAGWYYSSKDGRYYRHENGEYVPLEYDEAAVNPPGDTVTCDPCEDDLGREDAITQAENEENEYEVSLSTPDETPSEPTGCSNDQPEHPRRPSSWVEDTLIELYLAGYNQHPNDSNYERPSGKNIQDYQMLSPNGDDDAEELEEGEWIPEEDFDPQEENFDEAAPSREEEIWLAQYGQVIESTEKTLPEIPSVDLWDWKLVCESRKADDEEVARLVGRLVKRSANLHPSVASGGTLLKTAPICEARLHLVRVKTGQVYKLRNPSAKYLASLSIYDSSNPTKDWGFPDISATWKNPDIKRKAKKVKSKTDCKLTVKPREVDIFEIQETKRKAKKVKPKTDCKLTLKPQDEVIEERSCSYRDRAAERRNLHGGYGVGPGQKGTTVGLKADESLADPASEEEAAAEALELSFGSGSYARRIMGNMGWKEGETLGKNTKGLVEPIQAVGNTGNVGLGYPQRRRK